MVKEPWNRYRLKDEPDDVDLLGKLILQKVVKIQGSKKVSLGSQNIFVTWAPESLKGKPSRSIPPFNTIPDKEKREVQFEILHEDWNHYTLKTGRDVKIRLIVSHRSFLPITPAGLLGREERSSYYSCRLASMEDLRIRGRRRLC